RLIALQRRRLDCRRILHPAGHAALVSHVHGALLITCRVIAPQFGTFQGYLRAEDNPKMSSGRSARASCILLERAHHLPPNGRPYLGKLAGEDAELRSPPRIVIE